MGTFTRHYKLWLWDSGASSWREVDKATSFRMSYNLNGVPTMAADLILTDENLQDLMVAGTPWRVTNNTSTDGTVETGLLGETLNEAGAATGSREILVGVLKEPEAENRTALRNSKPVFWRVSGVGYGERLKRIVRDVETSRSGNAGTVITNYVNNDIPDSSSVALGTIDTGPSIDVKHRKDRLLPAVLDIARIGDGTDKFFYYVHVNDDGSRTPQLNYLSPTNALFETSDPTGGTDSGRVLDETRDCRSVRVTNEEKRIMNAVKVRFAGIGSGEPQNETAFATDSSSITEFGRREEIRYAPWILPDTSGGSTSTTAETLRDTLEDMYDGEDFAGGTYEGIKRAKVTLRTGELFQSGFDAHPGDVVAVDRAGSTTVIGRFLGFEFKMGGETLSIEVGLPRVPFLDGVSEKQRTQRQALNSFEITQSSLSTETTPVELQTDNTLVSNALNTTTFSSIAPGNGESEDFSVSSSLLENAHVFYVDVELAPTAFQDGPIQVTVSARGSGGGQELVQFPFTAMQPSTTHSVSGLCYPFAVDSALSPDTIRISIENNTPSGGPSFSLSSGNLEVYAAPQHSIDLSHTHNM